MRTDRKNQRQKQTDGHKIRGSEKGTERMKEREGDRERERDRDR